MNRSVEIIGILRQGMDKMLSKAKTYGLITREFFLMKSIALWRSEHDSPMGRIELNYQQTMEE